MSAPDPQQFYTRLQDVQQKFGGLTNTSQFMVNLGLSSSGASLGEAVEGHLLNSNVFDEYNRTDNFNFFCSDATLPGSAFDVMELQGARQGIIERIPNRRIYTDFDLTFYVDTEYKILRLFEEWMNYIDPVTSADGTYFGDKSGMSGFGDPNCFKRLKYPVHYKRPIMVHKFERDLLRSKTMNLFSGDVKDKKKVNIVSYIFLEAFPMNIQAIPFSYDGSSITKVSVNFAYTRYLVTKNAGIGKSAAKFLDSFDPMNDVKPFGNTFDGGDDGTIEGYDMDLAAFGGTVEGRQIAFEQGLAEATGGGFLTGAGTFSELNQINSNIG